MKGGCMQIAFETERMTLLYTEGRYAAWYDNKVRCMFNCDDTSTMVSGTSTIVRSQWNKSSARDGSVLLQQVLPSGTASVQDKSVEELSEPHDVPLGWRTLLYYFYEVKTRYSHELCISCHVCDGRIHKC